MKQGWEIKKLGEVCEVLNGFAFKSDKYVEKGTRIIRITNVQKGLVVDDEPKFYSDEDMTGLNQYQLYENDLLMSLTGNVGRVGLLTKEMLPAALNQRVACLRIKNEKTNIRYLFHYLNSSIFEQEAILSASGIAQKNMSTEWLKKHLLPVPPLPEQEKIVSELDCLSGLIEKKRQQLKELDALAQSIFYEMFGNPEQTRDKTRLIDIYKFIDYRGKTPIKTKEGIPLITAKNIRKGYIDYSIKEYISDEEFSTRQTRGIAQKGDLLFTTEAPMGYVAIADIEVFSTGQRLITFQKKPDSIVDNIYVMYYLLSGPFQSELNNQATGATVKGIKGSKLEQMTIPLPPLPLQQTFAQKVEAIEKQKELIKQSIIEAETLFNSRMNAYFN